MMSGRVRREHDLAGQSLQKVQLHIWPRASEGMRSTHTHTHILPLRLSHALSHAPFLSHGSSFSHFQAFNPSLVAFTLWIYLKRKIIPSLILLMLYLGSVQQK